MATLSTFSSTIVTLSILFSCMLLTTTTSLQTPNKELEVYWRSVLPKTPIPTSLQYYFNSGVKNSFSWDEKIIYTPTQIFINYGGPSAANMPTTKTEDNVADFVLEEDLKTIGANMDLHFYTSKRMSGGFLSRSQLNSVPPFSSEKLPEILSHFSITPNSLQSMSMKGSLTTCESPPLANENKYCATSLESMVDYATSTLGTKDITLMTTITSSSSPPLVKKNNSLKQRYKIVSSATEFVGIKKAVICHPVVFPYAVFYCHMTTEAKIFSVPLVGEEDGNKVKAMAVCHTDTSRWSPKHMAFAALHVQPGTVPVCHFLPEDHIIWVPTAN